MASGCVGLPDVSQGFKVTSVNNRTVVTGSRVPRQVYWEPSMGLLGNSGIGRGIVHYVSADLKTWAFKGIVDGDHGYDSVCRVKRLRTAPPRFYGDPYRVCQVPTRFYGLI